MSFENSKYFKASHMGEQALNDPFSLLSLNFQSFVEFVVIACNPDRANMSTTVEPDLVPNPNAFVTSSVNLWSLFASGDLRIQFSLGTLHSPVDVSTMLIRSESRRFILASFVTMFVSCGFLTTFGFVSLTWRAPVVATFPLGKSEYFLTS